eukprot:TRINITY_DN5985_c0_g1_i2.p1 TRINITY_DN5985_c0_g1~~TRINITY_DN5985_c0_g1_i2.p1  ORF type:complete len:1011 (-),score=168.59 TRINITY_DN5985_c0_g1_i2:7-3039(-)
MFAVLFAVILLYTTGIHCQGTTLVSRFVSDGTRATDWTNINSISATAGSSIRYDRAGLNGSVVCFEGSDYLSFTTKSVPISSHDRSISVWAFVTTSFATNQYVMYYGGTTSGSGYGLLFDSTMKPAFTNFGNSARHSEPIPFLTWVHIGAVTSNGVTQLYVNGKASNATLSGLDTSDVAAGKIGYHNAPSSQFNGCVTNMMIFNTALTPLQMWQLYTTQGYGQSGAAMARTPCALGTYSSAVNVTACTQCPAGFYSDAAGSSTCAPCPAGKYSTVVASTSAALCVVCPPGTCSAAGATRCSRSCEPTNGLVLWYSAGAPGHTRFGVDTLSVIGSTVNAQGGINGQAWCFAPPQYLEMNTMFSAIPLGAADRTVAGWVYLNAAPAGLGASIFSYGAFIAPDDAFIIGVHNMRAFFSQFGDAIFDQQPVALLNWTHVAASTASGYASLYVNGVLVGSKAVALATTAMNGFVGRSQYVDPYAFNGCVSDVMVYNLALAASEIRDIFTAQGLGRDCIGAACTACPRGTYSSVLGQACQPCPAGWSSPVTGATSCQAPITAAVFTGRHIIAATLQNHLLRFDANAVYPSNGASSTIGSTVFLGADGKVGINTQTPTVALEVNGDVSAQSMQLHSSLVSTGDISIAGNMQAKNFPAASPYVLFDGSASNRDRFLRWLQDYTNERRNDWWSFNPNAFVRNAIVVSGTFASAVALPDGGVIFVPYSAGHQAVLYRGGITSLFPLASSDAQSFVGGVLLPSGKVVLVPHFCRHVVTLDPVTMTVTEHPQDLGTAPTKFYGGVLLPNGKVFFNAHTAVVGVFDPISGITVTIASFYTFPSSVLLPDGRVLCVPYSNERVMMYDYRSNELVLQTASGPHKGTDNAFLGGILLPNGNVLFVPFNYFTIVMYNPTSDQFISSVPVTNPVALMFAGGCLLPNGIAVFAPYYAQRLGFFDYRGGVNGVGRYFEGNSFGSSDLCVGATLLTTGQVVIVASAGGHIGMLNTNMDAKEMATHPSFNKF